MDVEMECSMGQRLLRYDQEIVDEVENMPFYITKKKLKMAKTTTSEIIIEKIKMKTWIYSNWVYLARR